MKKIRMITIQRTVEEIVPDKKGASKVMKVKHWYPCKVNASVPFDHQMCQ